MMLSESLTGLAVALTQHREPDGGLALDATMAGLVIDRLTVAAGDAAALEGSLVSASAKAGAKLARLRAATAVRKPPISTTMVLTTGRGGDAA